MKILIWHVHGSWMTSFVQGSQEYLVPVLPGRGPDGRGRAQTWDWPRTAKEVTQQDLRAMDVDLVVLQRPHEVDLVQEWTGRRPGDDLPAIYVEHNTPAGPAPSTVHPLADQDSIPIVHVTHFNQIMWDCGIAPTTVIEHGIVDPGHRYTGAKRSLGVVVNEPVRRTRAAGTDLALALAQQFDIHFYGMRVAELAERNPLLDRNLHEDVPQDQMHTALGAHRIYLHPYRWTSLGLSLIEAMMIGMPVLALNTTEAPVAVPAGAGVLSNDLDELASVARYWLANPTAARETGLRARNHARSRYGLHRFLTDWEMLMKERFHEDRHGVRARKPAGDHR